MSLFLLSLLALSVDAAVRHPATNVVDVYARARAVDTGLCVRAGETLRFSTPPGAVWVDAGAKRAADGSGASWFYPRYMRLWSRCLAAPRSPAFALHGRVGSGKVFLIGLDGEMKFHEAGPLVLFTNDVPLFYWNNWGSIAVQINRTSKSPR